jgi:hypothetical protein
MALNKAALKSEIKTAFLDELGGSPTSDQSAAIDRLAGKIADACDTFVRGATVTSTPVLTSPSGPVTGTITNTVS